MSSRGWKSIKTYSISTFSCHRSQKNRKKFALRAALSSDSPFGLALVWDNCPQFAKKTTHLPIPHEELGRKALNQYQPYPHDWPSPQPFTCLPWHSQLSFLIRFFLLYLAYFWHPLKRLSVNNRAAFHTFPSQKRSLAMQTPSPHCSSPSGHTGSSVTRLGSDFLGFERTSQFWWGAESKLDLFFSYFNLHCNCYFIPPFQMSKSPNRALHYRVLESRKG